MIALKRALYIIMPFLLFKGASGSAFTADSIVVSNSSTGYIGEHVEILCDSNSRMSFLEVTKARNFEYIKAKIPNLGITDYTFWLKFRVHNKSKDNALYINIKQPGIDRIQFYDPSHSTSVPLYSYGDTVSYRDRVFQNQNYIFPINVLSGSTSEFFVKIHSGDLIQLPIEIGNTEYVYGSSSQKDSMFGLYAGVMLAMLLYNLFIYFTTREKFYLLYVTYVSLVFLTQTNVLGYTGRVLFPDFPILERYAVYVFAALVPLGGMLFMVSFLRMKQVASNFIPFMYVVSGVYMLALGLALTNNFQLSYKILQGCASTIALYQLVVAIILTVRQVPQARNFLVAWSAFLVGVIVFVLKDFEIMPYNDITYNMMSIGSAVECVLLSFALADRINALKREKEMSQNRMLIALKENERIISDQNTELERRVGERTVALEQSNRDLNSTLRNLRTAQKQLVEAEKMASLGQMTAGIAHELNNPINFVQSNVIPLKRDIEELTELIRKVQSGTPLETHEKSQVEFIQHEINQLLAGIDEGSRRTSEIIRGLRIFSRLDRDSLIRANINECILSTLIVMKSITKGEITIQKELDPHLPSIECFPGKLNQVFVNLITNAIHATRLTGRSSRERLVDIKTSLQEGHIVITIKDNGLGMDEETRRKIFDPFFTTKDVGEGVGLGLSIVLGIVNEHNGRVDVKTCEGNGTEFLIYLPATSESILRREAAHEH